MAMSPHPIFSFLNRLLSPPPLCNDVAYWTATCAHRILPQFRIFNVLRSFETFDIRSSRFVDAQAIVALVRGIHLPVMLHSGVLEIFPELLHRVRVVRMLDVWELFNRGRGSVGWSNGAGAWISRCDGHCSGFCKNEARSMN